MNSLWGLAYFTSILAQEAQDQLPAEGPAGGASGGFTSFLPVIMIMFAVVYFLMIRPEKKRNKARMAMLKDVKKGDVVVTPSGIIGKIHRVDEKEVVLQVDKDSSFKMRFLKSAVNEILPDEKLSNQGDSNKAPATETSKS